MTPEIPTLDFKFNDATVTIRQEVGMDVAGSRVLWRKLIAEGVIDPTDEVAAEFYWGDFSPAVLQTVSVDGSLGFPWVTVKSPTAEIATAFEAFNRRPKLVGDFRIAIRAVEKLTPGDAAILEKKEPTGATPDAPSASPSMTGSPTDAAPETN